MDTIAITREALWLSIAIGGPIMIVALAVGTVIGLVQALTSVQEMTLTFAPKLLAILAALWLLADFMAVELVDFLQGQIVDALLQV